MIGIAVNGDAAHFAWIPDLTLHRKLAAYATGESDSRCSDGAKGKAWVLIPFGTILANLGILAACRRVFSGYVATNQRPHRRPVIPDACRREIQDGWLRGGYRELA